MFYIYRTLLGLILNTWLLNHTDADIKTDISLGHVNDLHTWQFPAGRPADLDKIKSSDWSKVGMLYRRGGH